MTNTKNIMMLSREVRRVPLDFDAPIGDTWAPLIDIPEHHKLPPCPDCFDPRFDSRVGSGMTKEANAIADTFYALDLPHGAVRDRYRWNDKLGQKEVDFLVSKGRLSVWRDGKWNQEPRDAAEVNAEQNGPGFGHDGINRRYLVEFRCNQLGITYRCPSCDGHGDVATPELRQEIDEWRPPEIPTGPGYQLWQSVSEGGPVSPVFETPEELAVWLAENEDVAGYRYTVEEWSRVIEGSAHGFDMQDGSLL